MSTVEEVKAAVGENDFPVLMPELFTYLYKLLELLDLSFRHRHVKDVSQGDILLIFHNFRTHGKISWPTEKNSSGLSH